MHPMISHRNNCPQRNNPVAMQGGNLRHRIRVAYEGWKRRRTISALKSVNDHWLKGAGIDRNDIERLVDKVVQRDVPMPVNAGSDSRDQSYWHAAAKGPRHPMSVPMVFIGANAIVR